MFFKIKLAYNKLSEPLKNILENNGLEVEAYNEDNYSERKKAFALKNPYAAKETPFAEFFYKDKLEKVFYTENSQCTADNIFNFIKQWIFDNAKSGYIEIEQIQGSQVGRIEKGYTKTFMEGCSLRMSNISGWYRTSTVELIDWENEIFKTKNSIYKFKFNEYNFDENQCSKSESESAS